jgi:hypothetical protein
MTKQLVDFATTDSDGNKASTSIILTGPYGEGALGSSNTVQNVMVVAGGTGISFGLPIVTEAINRAEKLGAGSVELVWVIRKTRNVEWILPELAELRKRMSESRVDTRIHLYVTRDSQPSSSESLASTHDHKKIVDPEKTQIGAEITLVQSSSITDVILDMPGFSIEWLADHHPDFGSAEGLGILESWLNRGAAYGGRNMVFGSGVAAMGRDLRIAVAAENDASKVWKGDQRHAVEFHWDDRFS